MKPVRNIRREPAGWQVRIVRNGKEYAKYFRFTDGGVRAAFKAAKVWRDSILRKHGERKWSQGPRKGRPTNNTSGVLGVSKNPFGRWVATWHEDSKQHFRSFKTKKEAIAFRKQQEARLSR